MASGSRSALGEDLGFQNTGLGVGHNNASAPVAESDMVCM